MRVKRDINFKIKPKNPLPIGKAQSQHGQVVSLPSKQNILKTRAKMVP